MASRHSCRRERGIACGGDCAPRRAATACRRHSSGRPVVNNKGIQSFAPGVGVPASDLDVRLVSPRGRTALRGCGRRSGFMASRAVRRLRRPAGGKEHRRQEVARHWWAARGDAHRAEAADVIDATAPDSQIAIDASPDQSLVSLTPLAGFRAIAARMTRWCSPRLCALRMASVICCRTSPTRAGRSFRPRPGGRRLASASHPEPCPSRSEQ